MSIVVPSRTHPQPGLLYSCTGIWYWDPKLGAPQLFSRGCAPVELYSETSLIHPLCTLNKYEMLNNNTTFWCTANVSTVVVFIISSTTGKVSLKINHTAFRWPYSLPVIQSTASQTLTEHSIPDLLHKLVSRISNYNSRDMARGTPFVFPLPPSDRCSANHNTYIGGHRPIADYSVVLFEK